MSLSKHFRSILFAMLLFISSSFSGAVYAQGNPNPPPPPPAEEPGSVGGLIGQALLSTFVDNTKNYEANHQRALQFFRGDGSCVTCEIFAQFTESLFSGMQQIDSSGSGLIQPLAGIVLVFSLVYLGGGLIAGDANDLLSRWVVFYKLMLSMVVAIIVLQSGSVEFVWRYAYSLLFFLADGIVDAVQTAGAATTGSCTTTNFGNIYPTDAANALRSMMGTVCSAHLMATSGMSHGFAMWLSTPADFAGMIIFFIVGTVLIAVYGWLMIILPLRFIDIMIRLAIVSILSPVYVLAATFKPFRGYFFTALTVVLNAAAQFAILGIMFKLGDSAITQRINRVTTSATDGDYLALLGHSFVLIITAMVFLAVLKSVPAIASELTRSSNTGAGEGAAAATRATAAPAVIGGKLAGAAVVAVPAGMAMRAMAARGAASAAAGGGAAAGALGRGVT